MSGCELWLRVNASYCCVSGYGWWSVDRALSYVIYIEFKRPYLHEFLVSST